MDVEVQDVRYRGECCSNEITVTAYDARMDRDPEGAPWPTDYKCSCGRRFRLNRVSPHGWRAPPWERD